MAAFDQGATLPVNAEIVKRLVDNHREFLRFLLQQLLQFAAGLVLLAFGVERLGLAPSLAMALSIVLMWAFSLLVQWRWVFKLQQPKRRA